MKVFSEDCFLDFNHDNELSIIDIQDSHVELYLNGEYVGHVEVCTDSGNGNREYILINHTIYYLDTLKNGYSL